MIALDQDLNEEIASVELRIHRRKVRVIAKGRRLGRALQRSLTSPAVLLLAAGTGFAIGRITEGNGAPGRTRLARAWFSISQGVRAAVAIVRAPVVIWLWRLFCAQRPAQGRKAAATRNGANPSSTVSLPPAPLA
jgi:hypothetical protein